MKHPISLLTRFAFCFVLVVPATVCSIGSSQVIDKTGQGIEGIWQGVLKFSGVELRIVFKISRTPEGLFTATMDSPDQGAKDIPVNEVSLEDGNLRIGVKSILGVFEGKLMDDHSTIEGVWKQSGMSLPLVLKRVEEIPEIRRPQEPKKPYPYEEQVIMYENKKAGIALAGTLTMPHSGGPFPVVLLITGSGAQDRDETVFGHRPFLVLADYLTRRGLAVLRVDDRGVGGSTGSLSESTSEDFASDVLAGIEYLMSREEINPDKIGLIGHSEGGLIAPMVAAESPDVAFIVMMAGPGIAGEEILYLQGALIGKTAGVRDELLRKGLALQKRMFAVLKKEKDNASAEKKLREVLASALAELNEEEQRELGLATSDIDTLFQIQYRQLLSPWFRFFLTYDPKLTLIKVKCPVLAITGEKDLQVPPNVNLQAIQEALKQGGNNDYTIKELSGLNHLFQTAETGAPTEYAKTEETISPTALQIIGDWILERVE